MSSGYKTQAVKIEDQGLSPAESSYWPLFVSFKDSKDYIEWNIPTYVKRYS